MFEIDSLPPIDHTRLSWDNSSKLGEGSFGKVYRGLFDANPVAIKVIKRPSSSTLSAVGGRKPFSAALKQQRREIDRYHVVRNEYIILFLGAFCGEDPRDLYIVTEYLEGGSLYDSLVRMRERHAVLDELSFLNIASHIARGLLHMHNQKFTHGDIKPQNVLLTSPIQFEQHPDGNCTAYLPRGAKVKLGDFGLSKRLEGAVSPHLFGTTAATADFGTGAMGTYLYMSPEAYKGVGTLSDDACKASDVYAYCLVLFELLSGLQSWSLEGVTNLFQLMLRVKEGDRPSWGPRKDHIDPRYIQLVEKCWRQEPTERPTIGDLVDQIDLLKERCKQRLSMPATDAIPNAAGQDDTSVHCSPERCKQQLSMLAKDVMPLADDYDISAMEEPLSDRAIFQRDEEILKKMSDCRASQETKNTGFVSNEGDEIEGTASGAKVFERTNDVRENRQASREASARQSPAPSPKTRVDITGSSGSRPPVGETKGARVPRPPRGGSAASSTKPAIRPSSGKTGSRPPVGETKGARVPRPPGGGSAASSKKPAIRPSSRKTGSRPPVGETKGARVPRPPGGGSAASSTKPAIRPSSRKTGSRPPVGETKGARVPRPPGGGSAASSTKVAVRLRQQSPQFDGAIILFIVAISMNLGV